MKPKLCPRCGNDVFTTSISFTTGDRLTTYSCSECGLAYEVETETWRGSDGKEWTMSEAGT